MATRPKRAKPVGWQKTAPAPRPVWKDKLYGGRWQRVRKRYLDRHPLCVRCRDEGRHTLATEVDHITPHKGDMTLFWTESNWQPLCKSCHSKKTYHEDGGLQRKQTGGGSKV